MAPLVSKWLAICCVILFAACGSDDDDTEALVEPDASSKSGESRICIDEDDDGYGEGRCRYGKDCDDNDPNVGDECIRCPACDQCLEQGGNECEGCQGCPCEPGTPSTGCLLPTDPAMEDQDIVQCNSGVMTCRDGKWSACEDAEDWLGL